MNKTLGYDVLESGTYKSINKPESGQIVTQAFILCCRCRAIISTNMGPRSQAICLDCLRNEKQRITNV